MAIQTIGDVWAWNNGGAARKNFFEVVFSGLPAGVGESKEGSKANDIDWGVSGGQVYMGAATKYQGLVNDVPCMRITNFTVPAFGVVTQDINFMATKYKIPSAKVDTELSLTMNFRVDTYWKTYKDLANWIMFLANPSTGITGWDTPSFLSSFFNVLAMSGRAKYLRVESFRMIGTKTNDYLWGAADQKATFGWYFRQVFPMKVGDVGFDYAAGDPVTIDVQFGYSEMDFEWREGDD